MSMATSRSPGPEPGRTTACDGFMIGGGPLAAMGTWWIDWAREEPTERILRPMGPDKFQNYIRVVLEMERHRIVGDMTLPARATSAACPTTSTRATTTSSP